ncbi:MAG: hypothetical protein ACO3AV_05540 [Ilumatobacteraceae bacterium]
MLRRLLPALAPWRPTVVVERVDLSDGETLQVLGHGAQRRVRRLSLIASNGRETVRSAAEIVSPPGSGASDGHVEFHAWLTLPPAAADVDEHDVLATLRVGRRRVCIVWGTDAFENPNAEVCRPVLPDTLRGLQRALRREPRGTGIRIITTALEPRVVVHTTHLGERCRLTVSSPIGTSVTALSWVDGTNQVNGRSTNGVDWEWDDLALLAVDGIRWSLRATTSDGAEHAAYLPHTDLRHLGTARVFPTMTLPTAYGDRAISLGADGGNRIVARCRAAEVGR